jgi:clathrin heavy chain
MIERSADAWDHNQFKDVIVRVANVEMYVSQMFRHPYLFQSNSSCVSYYKSLSFYLQEQPPLVTDLLTVLIPRIDHSRVVRMFRQVDHIPLIRSYLIAVQHVSSLDIR